MNRDEAKKVVEKYILLTFGANNNEPIDMTVLDKGNGTTRLEIYLYMEAQVIPELKEALETLKGGK